MSERIISEKEILDYMSTVKNIAEYRRWQIIRLVRIQQLKVTHAAKIIGVVRQTIYNVIDRFDLSGPEGMANKPVGGRLDSYMSLEEEKALLKGLFESGEKGLIITAQVVKEAAEQKLQMNVTIFYAYDLLHRHGWRKIKPRPKHPKNSKVAQEEFKKKYHPWSMIV